MKQTEVALAGNNSKHKSHLVKSLQSLNLKDFSKTPEGVWGSEATIRCGDVIIKSSQLDLEFDIPFDDNLEANEGEIIVYGLTKDTIRKITTKQKVTIEAGYKGDTGKIFDGSVRKAYSYNDGADRVTIVKIIDDIGEKKSVNISYKSKTKASYILKDLIDRTGKPIAKFEVERDWTYENAETIDEPLESAISKYSEVCGVSTFVSKGRIYCCKLSKVSNGVVFDVNESTGMIGSPSPFEETTTAEDYEDITEGFEVEMLLQHRMAVGALINLKSEQCDGRYYVKSGRHRFNESECTTTVKVV